ncbi:hypothetical protein JHJ32_14410 [Parapedobacter sp. ISTM3]|uniref:Uncharacterized protein n=1 Tax=Parapedobacter luteus TaxID=623280 RepID=A0A1T5EDJ4_9SPHI|nr:MULTISPECIES: hypothetical protein [Parapedobacter]MBK1441188.1 hypothetical protein [Parapedobacter sp. ISTM3]SKB81983.1 hypothetical protein SAMN05660226_03260 [Parapedobacter luteus]
MITLMKMNRVPHYLLVLLLLAGCSKGEGPDLPDPLEEGNDWDIVIPSSKDQPGFGDTEGIPAGTPWQLPEGIEVVARPDKPFNPDLGLLHGSLNTFYADVNFINRLNVTVTVEIPGGLICLFKHEGRTQNGILTSTVRLQVPPTYVDVSTPADTTTVYLGLGCLNYSMAFPWEENQQWDTQDYPIGKDMYEPGVVTTDPNIRKLLDLLKDYPKLRLTQHYNPQELFDEDYETPEWQLIYTLIQGALWEITDGPGLTRKDYRELVAALEPYK